jgi:hypothetical protein
VKKADIKVGEEYAVHVGPRMTQDGGIHHYEPLKLLNAAPRMVTGEIARAKVVEVLDRPLPNGYYDEKNRVIIVEFDNLETGVERRTVPTRRVLAAYADYEQACVAAAERRKAAEQRREQQRVETAEKRGQLKARLEAAGLADFFEVGTTNEGTRLTARFTGPSRWDTVANIEALLDKFEAAAADQSFSLSDTLGGLRGEEA